jgi:signal transduction histidine kinase
VDVERLRRSEPMWVPDLVHDLLALDDLARVGHEHEQEVELTRRELHGFSVLGHGAGRGIEPQTSDFDRRLALGRLPAPHDRADPRRELPRGERLHDVVVGAELEPQDPVDLLTASGEHDDRHLGALADLSAQVAAVAVGQHDVEQDDVGLDPVERLARALDGARHLRVEPVALEMLGERLGDGLLVLDDQDAGFHASDGIAGPDRRFCHCCAEREGPPRMRQLQGGGRVSATTASELGKLPRRRRTPEAEVPASLVALTVVLVALDVVLVGVGLWVSRGRIVDEGWLIAIWLPAVALVGLGAVGSESGSQLGLDMPLLLAAGFLFGSGVAGALAFVAFADPREFAGDISLVRGLYNRAQTSLAVVGGSVVFAATGAVLGSWPAAFGAALLAVGVDCLVNYSTVVVAIHLHRDVPLRQAVASLRVGPAGPFLATYVAYGLLSPVLAEIYLKVGPWGLLAFVIPVLLARQAFVQGQRLHEAGARIRSQREALRQIAARMADERRDERLSVAAGLHDEVLPPLFQVHLMGQVLRQDFARGQLLALEEDVPELVRAAEHASEAARGVIRSLRSSALGASGLAETLRLLCRQLEGEVESRFVTELSEVGGSPVSQLLAYQIAQEAIRNAMRHADASSIHVRLWPDGEDLRLLVEDDGRGFSPRLVDDAGHFGLALMRERAELVGGVLHVSSRLGSGTTVALRLPLVQG